MMQYNLNVSNAEEETKELRSSHPIRHDDQDKDIDEAYDNI